MIIDCFTFFNELDLLELRLNELDGVVDYFILVEASKTQSLLDKPFFFEENKHRFSKFLSKIIHVKVQDCPRNDSNLWTMEHFQRNCITRGLSVVKPSLSDWILISDLDEIPSAESLIAVTKSNLNIFSLEMEFSAYFVNLMACNRKWIGTVGCKFGLFDSFTPQNLRDVKDSIPHSIKSSGWHFSWLGGYERVYQKALSCIEPYDKTALPSKEAFKAHFDEFLNSGDKFFIHLENLSKKETEFKKVSIDESFPSFLTSNMERFSQYILQ